MLDARERRLKKEKPTAADRAMERCLAWAWRDLLGATGLSSPPEELQGEVKLYASGVDPSASRHDQFAQEWGDYAAIIWLERKRDGAGKAYFCWNLRRSFVDEATIKDAYAALKPWAQRWDTALVPALDANGELLHLEAVPGSWNGRIRATPYQFGDQEGQNQTAIWWRPASLLPEEDRLPSLRRDWDDGTFTYRLQVRLRWDPVAATTAQRLMTVLLRPFPGPRLSNCTGARTWGCARPKPLQHGGRPAGSAVTRRRDMGASGRTSSPEAPWRWRRKRRRRALQTLANKSFLTASASVSRGACGIGAWE